MTPLAGYGCLGKDPARRPTKDGKLMVTASLALPFCMAVLPRWTIRAASARPSRVPRLGEFWKYRVGDYRVIARIEDDALRVLVVRVGSRDRVYR